MTDLLAIVTDNLVPFLVILTVLVFVHEYGHYAVARRAGVRVEVFSIGFGPELFGWTARSGTRWKFSAVPLGGYVRMFGDSDPASATASGLEEMSQQERDCSFHHKPLRDRTAIVAAGPAANFLFAILVLAVLYATVGERILAPTVAQVMPGSAVRDRRACRRGTGSSRPAGSRSNSSTTCNGRSAPAPGLRWRSWWCATASSLP